MSRKKDKRKNPKKAQKLKPKKDTYLFIDTNSYLACFGLSSGTFISLKKLLKLIKKEGLKLILPNQVKDEYWRGRQKRIKNTEDIINKLSIQEIKFHKSFKDSTEVKEIEKYRSKGLEQLNSLKEKSLKDFREKAKKTEEFIESIFQKAEYVKEDKKIIERAYFRYLKGNPPFQKDRSKGSYDRRESYGDAIIWETLLEKFSDKDLTIVTDDPGWYFDKQKGELNELLIKEWKEKGSRKIKAFGFLGNFINEFTGQETIKEKVIQEEKVEMAYSSALVNPMRAGFSFDSVNDMIGTMIGTSVGKRYCCPFCKKDITIELINDFPHLEELISSFAYYTFSVSTYLKTAGMNAQCPYCDKSFLLNNII